MNYIKLAYKNADSYDEQDILVMQNQIDALKEKIRIKKQMKRKRSPEIYEDSIKSFMKMFLMQSEEQQKEILEAFKSENSAELSLQEANKPKRQRKVKEKVVKEPQIESEESKDDYNEPVIELNMTNDAVELKEEPVQESSKPKRGRPKKSEAKKTTKLKLESIPEEDPDEDEQDFKTSEEDSVYDPDKYSDIKSEPIKSGKIEVKEAPITPDLCEKDIVTDAGANFITRKPPFDDDEYRKVVYPILDDRIGVNREGGGILHIFGHDYTDIPLSEMEQRSLYGIMETGSTGLRELAQSIFTPYESDVDPDDPRLRHDLVVIAVESLRKKIYKATCGAIQLEYYIHHDDKYPYDEYVPYEAVSIRFRKAGPLDSLQEKNYQNLYESAKKSYSGS